MTASSLSYILLAHWVGDYLFQTNTMAQLKHKSIKWLSIHVAVYGATLFLFALLLFDVSLVAYFSLVNILLHFITDFFTSKAAARFCKNLRIFYSVIGFDQLIHVVTLIYTFDYYFGNAVF